ncbi:agmatine hydroxycinnamoyltransferase 1-like [Cryptomeria japonica]|uniref:agmatine hydroxycinnamoyltransferase 1-like n=1 Tax=Cryptomeria japonica TaxID=3369 RepID=UPI0027DA04BD|nr:agmatine hydroxycinnamoyltransferase 1-like [Cryptomeria japonica]
MKVFRGEGVFIKPSEGKDHRELVELSNLDLVAYPMYNKVVYVFEAPTPSSEVLKEGLAKVFAEFREWAGRYTKETPNGCLGINLNDEGVLVIEGEADGTIADAMPFHPSSFLLELVPPTSTMVDELLLMQFTRFACGGLVIGLASHHHVADGQATTLFMNSWGKVVRGERILPPVHDRSLKARDPPQPCIDHYEYSNITHGHCSIDSNLTIKKVSFWCIIFTGAKLKLITKARGLDGVIKTKASILVDCRKRVNPSLPKEYFGNVVYDSSAHPLHQK